MDGLGQMRSASELLAERAMERVLDLVVQAIDMDALARRVDMDALVQRVDLNAVVDKIDLNATLGQIDINRLIARVDIEAIVRHTDLGAVIAMSSGQEVRQAVDIVRAQAVTLDSRIDRCVRRLLRRKDPGPVAPRALHPAEAGT